MPLSPPTGPPLQSKPPNFDRLARPYRVLEYLTLGTLLKRTRNYHLPLLAGRHRALLLGDGDGRFAAALARTYPGIGIEAVDGSPAMLAALRRRCPAAKTVQADLRSYAPESSHDLIVTHFVLDCLTEAETEALAAELGAHLATGGLWLVSEFRVPTGAWHWPARASIRLLYFAFRLLTGLRVARLPDYATPMRRAGLRPVRQHRILFGILTTELWQKA